MLYFNEKEKKDTMNYFYGLAANPFTIAHDRIILSKMFDSREPNKVYVGITEHDYKSIELPYDLRKSLVEHELTPFIESGAVVVLKQDQRTYKFLTSLDVKIDTIIIGEDEWEDLKAGKWHYSNEILNTWKIEVIERSDGISSTKVREMIKNGCSYEDIKHMISEDVFEAVVKFYKQQGKLK